MFAGVAIVGYLGLMVFYAVAASSNHSYREQRRVEGIEVVERGWTVRDQRVSFAAVVENTSGETVEPFALYATAYDAEDRPIEGVSDILLTVGEMGPGEQVGLGNTVYGRDLPEITRLAFDSNRVGGTPLGTVIAFDVELTRDRVWTTVRFEMDATFDETALMMANVVIRDADGEVVSGNHSRIPAGGESGGEVTILSAMVPEGATAEVYVVPT